MTLIRSRAPLRLGLAGGGTDVSPYCDSFGGAVLNATIDRHAYATLRTLDEPVLRLVAADQNVATEFSLEPLLPLNGELDLLKAVHNRMIETYNGGQPIALELVTHCDAPAGSGLGSSSTLVVAIIRAYVELLNLPLDDHMIAKLAFQIERVDCGLAGGRQDQYSATFGGFNFMEFYAAERAVITPLRIKNWIICELESSILLYSTGRSRESAKIIKQQSENVHGSSTALDAMHGIKNEAFQLKNCLLKGDFAGIVDSMHSGWLKKKLSSVAVSNSQIDTIFDAAIEAGALAGKVSGAGGGGFMWFFVPSEHRMDVIRSLSNFGGQISNCYFSKYGSQAWKL